MSFSSWDDVSTTAGIIFRRSSDLICCKTSHPPTFGSFRSSSMTAGIFVGATGEFPPTIEVVQSLLSVAGNHDLICQVIVRQRRQRKLHVVRGVLDDQNASQCGHGGFAVLSAASCAFGSEKEKVAPWSTAPSA